MLRTSVYYELIKTTVVLSKCGIVFNLMTWYYYYFFFKFYINKYTFYKTLFTIRIWAKLNTLNELHEKKPSGYTLYLIF